MGDWKWACDLKCIWIEGGLFQEWSDYGCSMGSWNIAGMDRVVCYSGNQGLEQGRLLLLEL